MRSRIGLALGIIAVVIVPALARAQTDPPQTDAPAALGESAPPRDEEPSERSGESDAEAARPDAPAWRWPGAVVWDLELRLGFPEETGFDRGLSAHGYGTFRIVPTVALGVAVPAFVEWLWIGGQVGVRGRTWDRVGREAASLVGADLLATVRARIAIGRSVEMGLVVGGGLGWMGTWVNGVLSDQLAPRFNVQADLAFRIGRHFALGPSGGWDYFQTPSPINAYGHGVDAGGFYFGLSLEGRE